MRLNKQEQDGEDIPIMANDNSYSNKCKNNYKEKILKKKKILITIISISIFSIIIIKYFNLIRIITKLEENIEEMKTEIDELRENVPIKKIKVAFIQDSLYGNGIGRILTVLTELLAKTGLYDVYIITLKSSVNEFKAYKDVKRIVQQKKNLKTIKELDKENDFQIYVLNNDVSNYIDMYKSLGKKVVGIFHGVFLSCIFTNNTLIYRQWKRFGLYDSFVQIIADDYWIYNKFNFQNVVYIPNLYTFEHTLTPSSNLTYNNVLIVGRIDDVIKGAQYGVRAMGEVLKEVPDAKLTIVSGYHAPNIKNLVKQLNIEKNVDFKQFSYNISEYYLNASVLIVASVSESFPMVMNEGKAHGLPVVAFNVDYSPSFQKGVITVEMFDYEAMGREVAKLLKDYNYRKRKGLEAKLSLDMYKNNETIKSWGQLFKSLLKGENEYRKFQKKIEKKYYNEKVAKKRIKKHYYYAQEFNQMFKCHSFENFTTLEYLNNIKECQINQENSKK